MNVEICVDSPDAAAAAEAGGAVRVELCANLFEGGTTPSAGCIRVTRERVGRAGLHVLIRPRAGDFLYSESEWAVVCADVITAKTLAADGVVVGCLTPEGDIDVVRLQQLVALARPMQVTFHRAFDMCREPRRALEQLVELGVDRLLTSGQDSSCLEGVDLIAELHAQAAGRIVVMPGGGITARNVAKIVAATGVRDVHMSARTTVASGMLHRNGNAFMGGVLRPAEFEWKTTSSDIVRAVVAQFNQ